MSFEYRGEHFTDEQQTLMQKRCPKCGDTKSLDDFAQYRKPTKRRGVPFAGYCKTCQAVISAANRERRKARVSPVS